MARILVCDSHDAVRIALAARISSECDLELAASVGSVGELFAELTRKKVDAVVLELMLPDSSGLDVVRRLTVDCPDVPVVIYTMFDEAVYAERAIRAGARGYVMKKEGTAAVVRAVRAALKRDVHVSDRIASRLENRESAALHPTNALSDLEMSVFQLLGQGRSIAAIADHLGVPSGDIEELQASMAAKLGLLSAEALVQYAGRIVHQ